MEMQSFVDDSSALLGLHRPLTKVQTVVAPLPAQNPAAREPTGFAEVTRAKRSVVTVDAGWGQSTQRFESEVYPIAAPLCPVRDVLTNFGEPSRLSARGPIVQRTA